MVDSYYARVRVYATSLDTGLLMMAVVTRLLIEVHVFFVVSYVLRYL